MSASEAATAVEEHLYKVLVIGDFGVGEYPPPLIVDNISFLLLNFYVLC